MPMSDIQKRAWELLEDIGYCMLVTRTADGLKSRPMSHISKPDEGKLYILLDSKTDLDDEVLSEPNVLLTLTDGSSKFVSLSAIGRLSSDRALIERLWNPGAQAFWPEGPTHPDVVAMVIDPRHCEYWDGPNSLVSAVKMAAAVATATTPDLGDNKTTSM